MVSRSVLFEECIKALENSGNPDARFDALCIFQDMLNETHPLFLPSEPVEESAEKKIRELTEKRCFGYPLQYLLGQWEFFGFPVKVGEGVLIPRPDTETLVEQIIDICKKNHLESPEIADLCSGSGCIAIALKKHIPGAKVYAVELSDEALVYLRQNVSVNNTDIEIIQGDVLDENFSRRFSGLDIIVSNPPYLTGEEMQSLQTEVSYEPEKALYGGTDGLDFYRRMTALWKDSLKTGGWLAYEFGMGQHDAVKEILENNSFTDIELRIDGGGIIRTAAGRKHQEEE
ncbi:MAG: peptide chain release factor N(5)-glutamine methyltransferase [Ruminococcus sp.]|nr:peptide chain release factor N(5)-glutamine methyltransferase [Ruminococcus sp.]